MRWHYENWEKLFQKKLDPELGLFSILWYGEAYLATQFLYRNVTDSCVSNIFERLDCFIFIAAYQQENYQNGAA